MSILDKALVPPPHRSRKRLYILIGIPVIIILLLVIFTNIPDDIAFVWHFITPPSHFTYSGHSDYVSSIGWSPDGKRIASASGDHTVQVWNMADGGDVLTYRG